MGGGWEQPHSPLVFLRNDLPSHRRQAHIPPTYDGVAPMKAQGATKDVVFLSGVRTRVGSFGGSLKDLSAIEVGTAASRQAIQRSNVPASDFGHVVFGNALQTSADAIYMARDVGLKAGLPIETPPVTVNRPCRSGFAAITEGGPLSLWGG